MADSFVGEIRLFGGNFAPSGWAFCNGQTLSISENDTLFSLLGTTYGGDGQSTFALPNLQGRVPIHQGTDSSGNSYVIGQSAGSENVSLTGAQVALHSHVPLSAANGSSGSPSGNVWAGTGSTLSYGTAPGSATLNNASIGFTGGGQPHSNIGPYLAVSYIISLYGIYPSRN